MMENASLFWSYTEIQNIIRRISVIPATQDLSLAQLALAGSGAGAVTSFFLYVSSFPTSELGARITLTSLNHET